MDELKDATGEAVQGEAPEGSYGVPDYVMVRVRAEDWNAAAHLLRRELEKPGAQSLSDARNIGCSAVLCSVLQQLRDFEPHHHHQLAVEINDLVTRLAPVLLNARGEMAQTPETRSRLANIVGFAAVNAAEDLPEDKAARLLDRGIGLMELSTSLTNETIAAKDFSFSANNLAMGYQIKARRQDAEGARQSLEHAIELMQRVIRADERLAHSLKVSERSVSRTMYLDHLNLGLVCNDLGNRTYSKKMISVNQRNLPSSIGARYLLSLVRAI